MHAAAREERHGRIFGSAHKKSVPDFENAATRALAQRESFPIFDIYKYAYIQTYRRYGYNNMYTSKLFSVPRSPSCCCTDTALRQFGSLEPTEARGPIFNFVEPIHVFESRLSRQEGKLEEEVYRDTTLEIRFSSLQVQIENIFTPCQRVR